MGSLRGSSGLPRLLSDNVAHDVALTVVVSPAHSDGVCLLGCPRLVLTPAIRDPEACLGPCGLSQRRRPLPRPRELLLGALRWQARSAHGLLCMLLGRLPRLASQLLCVLLGGLPRLGPGLLRVLLARRAGVLVVCPTWRLLMLGLLRLRGLLVGCLSMLALQQDI